jgi:hypothetical protein
MKRGGTCLWALVLGVLCALALVGCSTGGSDGTVENPVEAPDPTGVWFGYLGGDMDDFTIGVIIKAGTNRYAARMIRDDSQFISPEGLYLSIPSGSVIMTGYLDQLVWNAALDDYSAMSPAYPEDDPTYYRRIDLFAPVSTGRVIGSMLYSGFTYLNEPSNVHPITLYYDKTDLSPNANNLAGDWVIENALQNGNDIVLSIEPNVWDTKGVEFTGSDSLGNTFAGTIEIPLGAAPRNVYDVALSLNGDIELEGIAAYVLEVNTAGIVRGRTLAIGVNDRGNTYSVSGLAGEAD